MSLRSFGEKKTVKEKNRKEKMVFFFLRFFLANENHVRYFNENMFVTFAS